MISKKILFVIISLVLVIPVGYAQEVNFGQKANQELVLVIINDTGEIKVKHVVKSSHLPQQVELIKGTVENLIITDEDGEEQLLSTLGDNSAVVIFPSSKDSIVEYDLKNALVLKNNIWTLDFRYVEQTSFILPQKLDMVFVNERPIYLDDKKGFTCHGCQVVLEYMYDQPKKIIEVNWEDEKFLVEIKSFAEIEKFEFNQPAKEITFDVNQSNEFVTTVLPLDLLWGPYTILFNNDRIYFNENFNNGTHVWINMKPDTTGQISIIGTTVIPEFPIIAPLAVGFLMIMMVPLLRKFNLR